MSDEVGSNPIDDSLKDDNILLMIAKADWYAGVVEFLTTQQLTRD